MTNYLVGGEDGEGGGIIHTIIQVQVGHKLYGHKNQSVSLLKTDLRRTGEREREKKEAVWKMTQVLADWMF